VQAQLSRNLINVADMFYDPQPNAFHLAYVQNSKLNQCVAICKSKEIFLYTHVFFCIGLS